MKKLYFSISLFVVLIPALLLLGSMATAYISPIKLHVLAFAGYFFPLFWIANVIFLVWLSIRRSWLLLIPLLSLGLTWNHWTNTFQIKGHSIEDESKLEQPLRVMSYNAHLFDFYGHSGLKNAPDEIFKYILRQNPDVICFQEFYTSRKKADYTPNQIIARFKKLGYRHIEYLRQRPGNTGYGLATFSRYPIIHSGAVRFDKSNNLAIYSDINVNGKKVRIFNNHLESIGFKDGDLTLLDTLEFSMNEQQRQGLRKISQKLTRAFAMRSNQAEALARHISNAPHPVIVCGDFNDTPVSYVYQTMRGSMKDAFKEAGVGLGGTYNGRLPSIRIDYIFHSPQFDTYNFKRLPLKYSDHFPIMVTIDLKK